MSTKLNGTRYSPAGSRVPTELLPTALRYERARAAVFEQLGQFSQANECRRLTRVYEQRVFEECDPAPQA
mgnify:CR=1 FL=1